MQKFEEIIQRTWKDTNFKKTFIKDPKSVLKEYGNQIGDDIKITVHDDSKDAVHFVLLEQGQMAGTNLESDPLIGKVMVRAHKDKKFKERLLKSPASAVEEVLGVKAPSNIKVYENTSKHIHIVLPANPETTGELSDSDLAMVAGGKLAMNCSGVGGFFDKAGATVNKVGDFFGDKNAFGKMFDTIGPLLTGGGATLTKVSNFFSSLKKK